MLNRSKTSARFISKMNKKPLSSVLRYSLVHFYMNHIHCHFIEFIQSSVHWRKLNRIHGSEEIACLAFKFKCITIEKAEIQLI